MAVETAPANGEARLLERRREELSQELLGADYETLTPIQQSVIDLIAAEAPSAGAPALVADGRTFWQRLADRVAAVGGSWAFIGGFAATLLAWMAWNLWTVAFGLAFDPYPFIFLNLLLSTLAAVQAPIILMSQNRQATRDREMAEHDYRINLRAELEIMHIHDKLDRLRSRELAALIARQTEILQRLEAAEQAR